MRNVAQVTRAVITFRGPFVISVISLIVLWQTPQIQEIYVVLAEDKSWIKIALAFVSLIAAAMMIWYVCHQLALSSLPSKESSDPAPVERCLLSYFPVLLAILPLVGVACGLMQSHTLLTQTGLQPNMEALAALKESGVLSSTPPALEVAATVIQDAAVLSENLVTAAVIVSLAAGVMIIVLVLKIAVFQRNEISSSFAASTLYPGSKLFRVMVGVTLFLVLVFSIQTVPTFPAIVPYISERVFDSFVEVPRWFGALPILFLFLITVTYFTGVLTKLFDVTSIPALSLLLVAALLWSLADINDNHNIRFVATEQASHSGNGELHRQIENWYGSRRPYLVKYFKDPKIPLHIYVVAAPGGGMYAANYVGLFLARMRDRCPRFAMHLFAVSGVSGGSVGGAMYAALADAWGPPTEAQLEKCDLGPQPIGPFEKTLRTMLVADFIAPVAGAALFPDFLQRFLFFPVDAFDRARAFEASLEATWAGVVEGAKRNPLRAPYSSYWSAENGVPMLIANATDIGNGTRVIISPFEMETYRDIAGIHSLKTLGALTREGSFASNLEIPLSTAASLSARFPYVLPVGSIWLQRDWKLRIADGGYFESSGAETAKNITQYIRGVIRAFGFRAEVRLIILDDQVEVRKRHEGLAEVFSPLRTLLRTWSGRSPYSVHNSLVHACENGRCLAKIWNLAGSSEEAAARTVARISTRVRRIRLQNHLLKLPLGWQLSRKNQNMIGSFIGRAENCIAGKDKLKAIYDGLTANGEAVAGDQGSRAYEFFETLNENNCVACSMLLEMRGEIRATGTDTTGRTMIGPDFGGRERPCVAHAQ